MYPIEFLWGLDEINLENLKTAYINLINSAFKVTWK